MRDEVLHPRMAELAVMQRIGGAADAGTDWRCPCDYS
jgi:hypothetical protein